MQKRNERIAYILFSIGVTLLFVLFFMLCIYPKGSKEKVPQEEMASVVLNGMEFYIPEGYSCYPDEQSGVLIYKNNIVIWLGVLDGSYEELLEKKEGFISQAEAKGYTCIAPVAEYQTDTRTYLYFVIDNDGRRQYIIYSPAGANTHISTIVDAPQWTTEEIMKNVDVLVGSARETEKEDTSMQDWRSIQSEPIKREFSASGVVQNEQENIAVSFQIPEEFYEDEAYEDAEQIDSSRSFTNYDANIFATVSLISDTWGMGAENYIRENLLMFATTDLYLKQEIVNGETVYYYFENHAVIYEKSQEQYYNFYALIDLGDGQFYKVEGFSLSNTEALELETYKEFLTIEIERKN